MGSSGAIFEPQIAALSGRWRCLAWDAPGYGASADPSDEPDIDAYADGARDVLDALDARPAHVLGSSWGGVIAVRLALRHPDAVRSLILANSMRGGGLDPSRAAALRARADDLEELGAEAFARAGTGRTLTDAAPQRLIVAVVAIGTAALRLPGFRYASGSLADTDHSERLGELQVPTLVITGEQDPIAPPEEARRLVERIEGSRLETISAASHLSNFERPDEFNALVTAFLTTVEASATES